MNDNIIVSVLCTAYNHEAYIRQCLDGFVMQKTDFKYEVIIHDDASTDKTAEIIREYEEQYPDIIKPIYQKENQYSKGGGIYSKYMYPRAKGKYIAICEGDDYWIDPYKLQKQVVLLESNKFTLCYTKANVYNQENHLYENLLLGEPFNNIEDLLLSNRIPTVTTVFRRDVYNEYIKEIRPQTKKWKMGDYPMWLWFSLKNKICFIDEVTAVYRLLKKSASHFEDIEDYDEFAKSALDIKLFYLKRYFNDPKLEIDIRNQYYRENIINGEKRGLRKYCLKNLKLIQNKTYKEYLKFLLYYTNWGFSLRKNKE